MSGPDKGFCQVLEDFRWLVPNTASYLNRIVKIMLLPSSTKGHHNASDVGASGVWLFGRSTCTLQRNNLQDAGGVSSGFGTLSTA